MRQVRRRTLAQWFEERPRVVSIVTIIVVVGLWSFFTRPGTRSSIIAPSPFDLVAELWALIRHGYMGTSLWAHFEASLFRTTVGFIAGSITGILVGLLMGHSRIFSGALAPFFSFVRPIPAIAYIPMMILWFGIGEFSKILLIFLASFLYVSMNTAAGVKSVPIDLLRVARTFGPTSRQLFFLVIFPESLPYVLLGLKVGLALSWAVVVAAELVAAQSGLGYMIMDAGTFFRIKDVYVGVFLIGLVGLLLEWVLLLIEQRVVHWSGKS